MERLRDGPPRRLYIPAGGAREWVSFAVAALYERRLFNFQEPAVIDRRYKNGN